MYVLYSTVRVDHSNCTFHDLPRDHIGARLTIVQYGTVVTTSAQCWMYLAQEEKSVDKINRPSAVLPFRSALYTPQRDGEIASWA